MSQSSTLFAQVTSNRRMALPTRTMSSVTFMMRVATRRIPALRTSRTLKCTVFNYSGYSLSKNIKDCYYVLRVREESSEEELKEAYFNLAKEYHPDSSTSTADPKKFSQIEQAYRTIQEHRRQLETAKREKEEAAKAAEEQESFFDIRHTAPQHRQYLSYEEFYGILRVAEECNDKVLKEAYDKLAEEFQNDKATFSQIEEAYEAVMENRRSIAAKANEDASEPAQERESLLDPDLAEKLEMRTTSQVFENAVMAKQKSINRKGVVGNVMDRLVEFHVNEAKARGELSNLKGEGKPLEQGQDNPMIDKASHLLNRVLINNGFAPDWIMLAKDIRLKIKNVRDDLLLDRTRAGEDLAAADAKAKKSWKEAERHFRREIKDINNKIHQLNLITPFLQQQMCPFNEEKECQKILNLYAELAAANNLPEIPIEKTSTSEEIFQKKGNIWKDFMSLFKS